MTITGTFGKFSFGMRFMVHSYESAHVAALEGIRSVLNHGPLWSSSLFVFKDWSGDSSNYFHGTQNIAGQEQQNSPER